MTLHPLHPQRCLHSHICKWNKDNYQDCIDTDCASHRYIYSHHQSEREKVLDNIMDLVDARIKGLDDLLATPPEQRTESAQDKYLKEARFELGLIQEEYKELRQGERMGGMKSPEERSESVKELLKAMPAAGIGANTGAGNDR